MSAKKNWDRFLAWFGPITRSATTITATLANLYDSKWFAGDLSIQQANTLLGYAPPATFLVRFSSSEDAIGQFTITYVTNKGGISNVRIDQVPAKNLCGFIAGEMKKKSSPYQTPFLLANLQEKLY